jgi:hypothetical protein
LHTCRLRHAQDMALARRLIRDAGTGTEPATEPAEREREREHICATTVTKPGTYLSIEITPTSERITRQKTLSQGQLFFPECPLWLSDSVLESVVIGICK